MPDIIELGRAKKAQRPGVYDHVSDLDLGKAIKLKFPDAYQDFTEFVGPRAPTDLPPPDATQPPPQSGPVGKFMDKAWEQVNPEPVIKLGADLMAGASRTPDGAARTNQAVRTIANIPGNVLKSQAGQFGKAKDAFTAGNYGQATAHAIGGVVPIVGPPLADAVQDISEGRTAEGFGTVAGIALPGVAKLGNRALQASKLAPAARDAAARSYTRALNPANLRDTKMMGDVATAVHGKPANATSGAAPGLKVTAPIALTRGGLQEKLQTRSADLGQQIETLQSAIPEGTITLPFADVASRVGQGLRDRFTITPQSPTINGITSPPIAPSPTTMDAAGAISSGASELRNLKKKSVRPTVGPPPAPVTTQIPTTTTSPILGPNGQPIISTTYTTKVTQPPAPRGPRQIDYQVVRKVKQGLDAPLSDKGRFSPIVTSEAAPRVAGKENVANTLRTILNEATPEIAEVNKKYAVAKSATDAIDRTVEILASRKEPISQRLANALTASMLVGNGVGATGMVAKSAAAYTALNIHRLVRSTAWNTMSGAAKAKLADLIESGDFVGVNGLLAAEGIGQVGKQITPPPSENYKMGDSKKKDDQPLPKVGTTRTSPIGADEVVVSQKDLPRGALASQRLNTIRYRPEVFNDPNIIAHENIHIGQSRLAAPPPVDRIRAIFGDLYDTHKGAGPHPEYEVPAYALDEPLLEPASNLPAKNLERVRGYQVRNEKRVADYLNMLRSLDLGENGIAAIETSMHEPVLRKYLTGPIPPPPYTPNPILRDNIKPVDGYDPYLVGRKGKASQKRK